MISFNQIHAEVTRLVNAINSGGGGGGGGSDTHEYSTDEHVIGKWIDGSNVYEKTIVINKRLNSGLNHIQHGIVGLTNYISSEIMLTPNDNSFYTFLPHTNIAGLQYSIGYWYQTVNEFIVSVGSSMVNDYTITLTVRYLK